MKVVNLCPHPIRLMGCAPVELAASVRAARVETFDVPVGRILGVPVLGQRFGNPADLPSFEEGVLLVVSSLLRSFAPGRSDLLSPARLQRDAAGSIIGCAALGCNPGFSELLLEEMR